MAVQVTGTGPAEMKLLAAKLRAAPAELKRDLRRNMRDIAGPAVRKAQASILEMPSHHAGAFRGEIARTVSASVGITRNGARLDVVSAGRKMPEGKQNLNGYTDQPQGWWHPVFGRPGAEKTALAARRVFGPGNRKQARGHGRGWVWTRQVGRPGWFESAVGPAARDARNGAQQALDEARRKLS